MIAKVSDDQLIKYPYDFQDLLDDNPYTEFDARFNLMGWFIQTEEYLINNHKLVEVKELPKPIDFNPEIQKIIKNNLPSLDDNGQWVLGWSIFNKTDEELAWEQHIIDEYNRKGINPKDYELTV